MEASKDDDNGGANCIIDSSSTAADDDDDGVNVATYAGADASNCDCDHKAADDRGRLAVAQPTALSRGPHVAGA